MILDRLSIGYTGLLTIAVTEIAAKKICNWGFQERSMLKVQALVTSIEEVCGAGEI